ncbi:hypothetical protein HDU76_013300 [Blyttiomyces sp. JEL0837]|nr:hypothetical protein HDU76_013300 [Blyttiomyces sp. JEL0837]
MSFFLRSPLLRFTTKQTSTSSSSIRRTLTTSSHPSPPPSSASRNTYLALGLISVAGGYYAWTVYNDQPANQKKKGTLGLDPVPKDTSVVFVLGGPGAGKGTQCANIVRDFGFVHLSAGDLLREERNRPGSPYGELINNIIKEGQIVPMEITISLLHAAMKKSGGKRFLIDGFPRQMDQAEKFEEESGGKRFLIDGFPRQMDQAEKFEEEVCESKLVLFYECPEEEMLRRLLKRGETSGRVDDNIESIKKRFQVFKDTSYPVVEAYEKRGKVAKVSCINTVDGVYKETKAIFEKKFGH